MTTRLALMLLVLGLGTARAAPPEADVRLRLETGAPISLEPDVTRTTTGPITTQRIALVLKNAGTSDGEARVHLTLPLDAVVGRLALEVNGRWMEGEVLSSGVATRIYESIVRPVANIPRDPALLVSLGDGQWSLSVFPIPPSGRRDVELVVHRVAAAKPGVARIERLPPSIEGGGRAFAIVPRFDEPARGAPAERIIVAIDTSLSLGTAGLERAKAIARDVLARDPAAEVVFGDRLAGRCGRDLACVDGLTAGGATDLAGLVLEAVAVAGTKTPSAIVLLSDGLPTSGPSLGVMLDKLDAHVKTAPLSLHTIALAKADEANLGHIADRGLGTRDPDLSKPLVRRPRYSVAGASDVELVPLGLDVVALGRAGDGPLRFEIVRRDDEGSARAEVVIRGGESSAGYGVARLLGSRLVASASKSEAGLLARRWGIASDGASLLALETDQDYTSRGIARFKAAERAFELGLPVSLPSAAEREADEQLQQDGDGDGIPDANDQCPSEPEVTNGIDDADGCPDRRPVVRLSRPEIRILERPYFPFNSARLQPQTLPLLDEIARLLREHPYISLVSLEGHSDNRESNRQKLSERRAEALREALVARGVDPNRFIVRGWADKRPMADNRTVAGRERNRRAELVILVAGDHVLDDLTPELVAQVRQRTGKPSSALEAVIARAALRRGDKAGADLAIARMLTDDVATLLPLFDRPLVDAAPETYRALVVKACTSGHWPPYERAEMFWRALVAPQTTDDELAVARPLIDQWLTQLASAERRQSVALWELGVSADLLERLGRGDEAARRRSELVERR